MENKKHTESKVENNENKESKENKDSHIWKYANREVVEITILVGMVINGMGHVYAFTVHLLHKVFTQTDLLEKWLIQL